MAQPAITFESLPSEIREEILLKATELDELQEETDEPEVSENPFYARFAPFNKKLRLYAQANTLRWVNAKQLRSFASLLRVSKGMRKDLLFAAKKHLTKVSGQIMKLPDPMGRFAAGTHLTALQLRWSLTLRWYICVERNLEKLIKQLSIEATGKEITTELTRVRSQNSNI